MVLKLYYNLNPAPCRAVVYTLQALDVPHEKIITNLLKNEQKREQFIKMNPQHTIPTIEDADGFILWDSHAINAYLITRYGNDNKLYPKDTKIRAIVNQRLHFHNGLLHVLLMDIINAVFVKGNTNAKPELKQQVEEAFGFLEKFLAGGKRFVAGNDITIADFSIATTITNLTAYMPLILKRYPLVSEYYKRNNAVIPGFQETEAKARESIRGILSSWNYEFDE